MTKSWPPPGFPLVQGDYDLTETWMIHLSEPFARRVEDGALVLWRPGMTIWMIAWGNDHGKSQAERLAGIKSDASAGRFAEREMVADGMTRFSYRLRDTNDDGPVESVSGFVINDEGHLQMAVYFDDAADEEKARELVERVGVRRRE